ncbi:SDR family NAD(P)-dependent oxidoreductase [Streptomyces sp. SID3343]|uniref:SDR family NAD(P)-dependent oxidoreductase n=1 Tax=Streptomyces sp. SID3343 TaxID=2690260 RepID=UPI00136C89F9|nr:SDR family NAD(P)-dependent oxidoreductase [Streptomyces sp. SID3343]MYW02237.1 SDR family NAD(P)-dependent oxidoreductase [Streptomyces sp. SID3343]
MTTPSNPTVAASAPVSTAAPASTTRSASPAAGTTPAAVREPRVWFVTGASRGLGRAFTEAALAAGDRVVGVARDIAPLAELAAAHEGRFLALPLDVSDRDAVFACVERAVSVFGRLDVVVNNAGNVLMGMVEEVTEAQVRAHLDVNFFGAVWVSQAVLPHLRRQGSGHILAIGSMGSAAGFASTGFYGAGKAALENMAGALAMETAGFGVRVTLVQAGGYETTLFTQGLTLTEEIDAYAPLRDELNKMWAESQDVDPARAAEVVMELVDLPDPPRRIVLGDLAWDLVAQIDADRREEHVKWESLSRLGG